jgi:hypothetical protein
MMSEMKNVEIYNRPAICCNLVDFDKVFADESDFVEVCEWKNGLGYDVAINDEHYSFTQGEFEAICYLIEQLNKN